MAHLLHVCWVAIRFKVYTIELYAFQSIDLHSQIYFFLLSSNCSHVILYEMDEVRRIKRKLQGLKLRQSFS